MFIPLTMFSVITFLVIAFNQKNINKYPFLAEDKKKLLYRSEILEARKERVSRLYKRLLKEKNEEKAAQADYIIRAIDNRLATLTYKDHFKFN